jgi:ribonuclease HII
MIALDDRFPQYGFAQHKGYPTAQHYQALMDWGACPMHRQSYRLS